MIRRSFPTSVWAGRFAFGGAVLFWGLTPTATRSLVSELTPEHILLWRFLFGGLFIGFIFLVLRPKMPARKDLPLALSLGLLGVLGFNVPIAFGIDRIEGGIAALLIGTQPVTITILAAVILGETIRRRTGIGLGLALAGTVIIAITGDRSVDLDSDYLIGCGLVLFGASMYALYAVLAKPHLGNRIPASSIAMIGTSAAFPLTLPFASSGFLNAALDLSASGWLAALVLALGASVLAPILFNIGLSVGRAADAGVFMTLPPVIGVATSVVFLGESLSLQALAGGILVISGVTIATMRRRTRVIVPPRAG